MRGPGITIGRVSKALDVSPSKLAKLWQAAHPGTLYRLPAVARDPAKPVAPIVAGGVAGVFVPRGSMSKEEWRAHRNAAVLHGRRTRNLPPVTGSEAADLVAQYLARGGRIAWAPPAATAPINSGRGFY